MSATTVRLLRAAAEIVGGNRALAIRLGLKEALLSKFLADRLALPDWLLLQAVDIILADRQSWLQVPTEPAGQSPSEALRDS